MRGQTLGLGIAVVAGLSAGPAHALTISVEESIIWQTPSVFPGATFTGSSSFSTGTFNADQHFFSDGSFGAQTYTVLFPPSPLQPPSPLDIFFPPQPILSGDAIIWQFGGLMAVAGNSFVTDAFPPSPVFPPNPIAPPDITIGLDLTTGFAPIDLTGGIFTFDDPVQVGTWEIRVAQVPEPSSLSILALALVALGALVGFKRNARKSAPA